MDQQGGDEPLVRGLTLSLDGRFDAMRMMQALSLRPIRVEMADANQACDISSGQMLMYTPKQRIEHDHFTGTTTATPDEVYSITQQFEVLFHAIDLLPVDLRQVWNTLTSRTIDLEVCWTNEPDGRTVYDIPEAIMARLGAAKIALRISVYASMDAVERACRERGEAPPAS